ncbi:hypothetical protein [Rhizobium sp. SG570]|uniref:hypothetical protein n=1 Tax=Rhizobium sp. SG570 TaxID=2587113 RepID=UPI00144504E4|nr:hypothetical protein [Rhizobium sp. SG570]NKJ39456.1 hypothetical protein [Rhizobium sp. SG570]NRP90664.1 hypothetical protein [Ensifer adhaerens]
MRYWEACEAQVTAAEECRKHGITAGVREADGALIDKDSGEVIGHPDGYGEFNDGDILGFLGY